MKFLKKLTGLPAPFLKALIDCYYWGFDDATAGLSKKDKAELEASLNKGFLAGISKRRG